jgi:hypothetical protein
MYRLAGRLLLLLALVPGPSAGFAATASMNDHVAVMSGTADWDGAAACDRRGAMDGACMTMCMAMCTDNPASVLTAPPFAGEAWRFVDLVRSGRSLPPPVGPPRS